MSRNIKSTTALSSRNADLLQAGYEYVKQQKQEPNVLITIRWQETGFRDRPFKGHQKLLERLRKIISPLPCIYFWCREREAADAIEHSHIAIRLPDMALKNLEGLIRQWVKGDVGRTAVDIRRCKTLDHCNAGTLIKKYFLKGLPPDLRRHYAVKRSQKGQGVIVGKRVGVSRVISYGLRIEGTVPKGRRQG